MISKKKVKSVDNRFKVQLQEEAHIGTGHSGMDTNGLWLMLHGSNKA